jgi:hypothetical protein
MTPYPVEECADVFRIQGSVTGILWRVSPKRHLAWIHHVRLLEGVGR